MRAIVVASNAVGPECRAGHGGTCSPARQRASGMARTFTSVRHSCRDAIQIESALVAAGRSGNQMNLTEAKRITPAALNFTRPHGAGNRFQSRIHRSPKPMRGFAKCLRLSPVGCLFHEQKPIMEGVGNVRKAVGEIQDE